MGRGKPRVHHNLLQSHVTTTDKYGRESCDTNANKVDSGERISLLQSPPTFQLLSEMKRTRLVIDGNEWWK